MHRDLQARTSIAIHHSTFVGNDEAQWSVQLLKQACDESNEAQRGAGTVEFQRHSGESGDHHGGRVSDNGRFVVLDIGGSISL